MATDNESFNRDLYDLLKVRGYQPVPLDSKNQRVPASQAADVIQFTFTKDGEEYGKAWVSIDDAANVIVYYDEEQQESPSNATPGVEYDDSWTGFLKHLKNWAQRRQLSFELSNKDRLGDDMRQRDYYKMKEKVSESYHPMGKKASYNDAVPSVKIILQHNRALEEGEQRYRNVAKIFLENQNGERFLAPTTRPGIARVYARHIAEGGVPNDDKWNHIKTVVEDYNKMAGFVRATRSGQFNESAQELVNEGINHYNNLRETLHKLATHRGYQNYFESYTPTLMEDELDESINELFVQEMVDPRIESAMPILSRLKKPSAKMEEVDSLAEWADSIINEKLELDEGDVVPFKKKGDDDLDDDSWIPSEEDFEQEEKHKNRKPKAANDVNEMEKDLHQGRRHDSRKGPQGPDNTAKMMKAKDAIKAARKSLDKAFKGDVEENFIGMAPQAVAEEELEEGPFKGVGKMMMKRKLGKDIEKGTDASYDALDRMCDYDFADERGFAHEKDFVNTYSGVVRKRKALDRLSREQDYAKKLKVEITNTGSVFVNDVRVVGRTNKTKNNVIHSEMIPAGELSARIKELMNNEQLKLKIAKLKDELGTPNIKEEEVEESGLQAYLGKKKYGEKGMKALQQAGRDGASKEKMATIRAKHDKLDEVQVEEDLDANQKRVGQLGPTEKVKNNNIGKLVGANESKEIPEELARIIEMARFKR